MAIAKVANQDAGYSNDAAAKTVAVAYPGDVTAGNFLVCAVAWSHSGAEDPVVTDGLGQTWTKATSNYYANEYAIVGIYYFPATVASTTALQRTVTATWGGTRTYRRIAVSEFSGVALVVGALNKIATAAGLFAVGTDTITTGNTATPSLDGELFFCALFQECNTAYVPNIHGTLYTNILATPGGTNYSLQTEYFVQTTAVAAAGTWNCAAQDYYGVVVATFMPPETLAVNAAAFTEAADTPTLVMEGTLSMSPGVIASATDNIPLNALWVLSVQNAALASAADALQVTTAAVPDIGAYEYYLQLVLSDAALTLAVDNIALNETSALVVDPAALALASATPTLTELRTLAVNSADFTEDTTTPTLNELRTLSVFVDYALTHAASTPTLVELRTLAVQDAALSEAAATPTLVELRTLAVQSDDLSLASSVPALNELRALDIQNDVITSTSITPTLLENRTLAVNAAAFTCGVNNVDIVMQGSLSVSSAVIASTSSMPTLTTMPVPDIGAYEYYLHLVIQAAAFAVASSTPTITVNHNLVVQNAFVGAAADSFALFQAQTLAMFDAGLGVTSPNIGLSTSVMLVPGDAVIPLDVQEIMMLPLTESLLKSRNVAPRDYCYKPRPRQYCRNIDPHKYIHDADSKSRN